MMFIDRYLFTFLHFGAYLIGILIKQIIRAILIQLFIHNVTICIAEDRMLAAKCLFGFIIILMFLSFYLID